MKTITTLIFGLLLAFSATEIASAQVYYSYDTNGYTNTYQNSYYGGYTYNNGNYNYNNNNVIYCAASTYGNSIAPGCEENNNII
jgi:hypothetical protein